MSMCFWKGYMAIHCLLAKLEKWKQSVDNIQVFGTLLTDFWKAFDCLPHVLLITESNTYRFCLKTLKLMNNYLSQTTQEQQSINLLVHGRKLS